MCRSWQELWQCPVIVETGLVASDVDIVLYADSHASEWLTCCFRVVAAGRYDYSPASTRCRTIKPVQCTCKGMLASRIEKWLEGDWGKTYSPNFPCLGLKVHMKVALWSL